MAYGPRRRECPGMGATREDLTPPAEAAVYRVRDPYAEAAQPAGQRAGILRFDEKMEVVVLDRRLNDPEPVVGGDGERAADGRVDPLASQADPRRRQNGPRGWGRRGARFSATCYRATGSSTTNRAPGPSTGSREMRPPCRSRIFLTTARPTPVPVCLVVMKSWKMRSRMAGGTPGPLSATVTRTTGT